MELARRLFNAAWQRRHLDHARQALERERQVAQARLEDDGAGPTYPALTTAAATLGLALREGTQMLPNLLAVAGNEAFAIPRSRILDGLAARTRLAVQGCPVELKALWVRHSPPSV